MGGVSERSIRQHMTNRMLPETIHKRSLSILRSRDGKRPFEYRRPSSLPSMMIYRLVGA
jgi:hypothetical protein